MHADEALRCVLAKALRTLQIRERTAMVTVAVAPPRLLNAYSSAESSPAPFGERHIIDMAFREWALDDVLAKPPAGSAARPRPRGSGLGRQGWAPKERGVYIRLNFNQAQPMRRSGCGRPCVKLTDRLHIEDSCPRFTIINICPKHSQKGLRKVQHGLREGFSASQAEPRLLRVARIEASHECGLDAKDSEAAGPWKQRLALHILQLLLKARPHYLTA